MLDIDCGQLTCALFAHADPEIVVCWDQSQLIHPLHDIHVVQEVVDGDEASLLPSHPHTLRLGVVVVEGVVGLEVVAVFAVMLPIVGTPVGFGRRKGNVWYW